MIEKALQSIESQLNKAKFNSKFQPNHGKSLFIYYLLQAVIFTSQTTLRKINYLKNVVVRYHQKLMK